MINDITKERMDKSAEGLSKALINGTIEKSQNAAEILQALSFHRDAEAQERKAIAMEREADNSDRKRDAYLAMCKAVQDFFTEIKPKVMELLQKQ